LATPLTRLEGKYEILEKIREGGMGSVYKVKHRLLEEVRVVKVMRPHLADDAILKERFLREAKVAIKLRHPNIAQIYDFTMDDTGYAYLVMEFIDGLNLQEVIKVLGRPGLGMVLEISKQSLDALGYLHRKKIIHRDVSPDNLLVTRDDEGALQVKLIDLGIAKVSGGDDSLTSAGTFLGKVRYSSPEHFKTQEGAGVFAASDLYSYGVVLYELLTGTYPIKGDSVASLISGHLMHPPLDFKSSDPDGLVPEELRLIVLKSLEKDPKNRYGSAASFAKALQPWAAENELNESDFQAIFDLPTLTTHKIQTVKPGSTQSRIDRSFGLSTTPPPGDRSDSDAELESSGTVETGGGKRSTSKSKEDSKQAQIRALLAGAGKLAEAEHFGEARMQLASVLELDADNDEAIKLLNAVEEADVELKERRMEAVDGIRILVQAESFDQAATQLKKAIRELGSSEIFDQTQDEIVTAKDDHEKRMRKVKDISDKAAKLISDEDFEKAVPLLREGLDLEPGNRELIARLEVAEKGLESHLDARRRAKEIEKTAATIAKHIEQRDPEEADRALALARKLYGGKKVFEDLSDDLDDLRHELVAERVDMLRENARQEIDSKAFTSAINILEDADRLQPKSKETAELLGAAREGLRLEEEERKRKIAIDDKALRIDRLILAGRFESAIHAIDAAVDELGDFELAVSLRKRVEESDAEAQSAVDKATSLLQKALDLAGDDAISEANDVLDEVHAIQKDHPQISDLVTEAETEINRRIEAHRRQMTINNVFQSVERQLDSGSVEEARRELGVARRLYGSSDELDELGARIEASERMQRAGEIKALLAKARQKNRSTEEAITDLEAVLEIDPHCEKAHRLLAEKRAIQNRERDAQLEAQCKDVLATIDDLIAGGDTAKALKTLKSALKEVDEFSTARLLRERLNSLS
jgi:serine/threonine protein kinase